MAKDETFRVVLAGGGSGGHVYPMLAVTDALQKQLGAMGGQIQMIRVGPRDGFAPLFTNRGIQVQSIAAGKVRRYASISNIIDIPKFFWGFLQAFFKIYFIMPDVIFSKGGTGALPVVIAGWWYRIPVVIHDSDAHPGLTNLASARFAKKVFVSFPVAAHYFAEAKTEVVGTPIRSELFTNRTTKDLAKEALGFSSSTPLVVIIGGSQGSRRINEFLLENLSEIMKITQVLHQTGTANFADVQKLSHAALMDETYKNRYQPINYFDTNLGLALTAADLVISRAGSNAIFELAAFGVPAILIPIAESANDHQRANAYEFTKVGAAVVIEENNLLPGIFLGQLKTILSNAEMRAKMSAAATQFFIPNAAEKIAQGIVNVVAGE